MNDEKIHIPAKRKKPASSQQVIRISSEAYNALVDIYNECTLSMKELASIIIMASIDRVVLDKED